MHSGLPPAGFSRLSQLASRSMMKLDEASSLSTKLSQIPPGLNASHVFLQIFLGVGWSIPSAGLQYGNTEWQATPSARVLHLSNKVRSDTLSDFAA